ncbi:MAG TPA: serine/threonine-protein kinase [Dokdonella sp.]|nr:serine/threonine-protein kinase [Dokdonella sp.]
MTAVDSGAHARLRALFDRLAEAPRDDHAAIMVEAGANADERRILQAWLAADDGASPLDTPGADWLGESDDADYARSLLGRNAGPYRLVEVLGRGGSSIVFRATRPLGDLQQTVALKLLQSGLYSAESRRRFRREQSILMQLSHPNIARLLDVGLTDAGVPYIAMEEVAGKDILAHADAEGLGRRRRLGLLVDVCRAIDAAHRALIVHRDIKPSNVLVGADGQVKVLDFGIAKIVEENAERTATQHIALTPDYAAPEQFTAGLVTTAADVYALGVLAGEMLVGTRLEPDATLPVDADASVRRDWRELDRDFVDILRTATAFEPDRRYVSAGHLADDIERFLAGSPVAAHPPSAAYRARKFIARHRALVTVTAAFAACILASLALAVSQAIKAQDAATRAHAEATRANAMRDFIFDAFAEAEPVRPHAAPVTVLELVDRASAVIRNEHTMDPHAQVELRTRLAEVVGSQGDLERSGVLLARIHDDAVAALGPDDPLTRDVERSLERNLYFRGKYVEARRAVESLLERADATSALAGSLFRDSASIAVKLHEPEKAVLDARRAVAIGERLGQDDFLREALKTLGSALLATGDLAAAVTVYERELDLSRQRFGADSDQVSSALSGLSRAYRRLGRMRKAERYAREALAIDRKIYSEDHWVVANHLNALGVAQLEERDIDGAAATFAEDLRICEATLGSDHPDVAIALKNVAAVHLAREDFANATPLLARALRISEAAVGVANPQTATIRADHGFALAMSAGDAGAGTRELDRALADLRADSAPDPEALGRALEKRIRVAVARGELDRARTLTDEFERAAAAATTRASYWAGRSDCLRGEIDIIEGRPREALAAIGKCGAALEGLEQADPVLDLERALLLATAWKETGDAHATGRLIARTAAQFRQLPYPPRRLQAWMTRLTR